MNFLLATFSLLVGFGDIELTNPNSIVVGWSCEKLMGIMGRYSAQENKFEKDTCQTLNEPRMWFSNHKFTVTVPSQFRDLCE